ncbi:MAG: hypothetical protein RBR06_01645 [Desulfuromonadaceae bacterium]|nr:hypothetical protein [Desulfuromonadaceae bacterium]
MSKPSIATSANTFAAAPTQLGDLPQFAFFATLELGHLPLTGSVPTTGLTIFTGVQLHLYERIFHPLPIYRMGRLFAGVSTAEQHPVETLQNPNQLQEVNNNGAAKSTGCR